MRVAAIILVVSVSMALAGCAITRKTYVFEPKEGPNQLSYYVVGQPYATAVTDCGDPAAADMVRLEGG